MANSRRETIAIYAKNWLPLLVIALVPEVPLLIARVTPAILSMALIVAAVIIYLLVPAATTYAVAQHHLGQGVDTLFCFKRAWHRILPLGTVLFTLLVPIAPIGSTLLYIDLRVRKEGYNVDTMAVELGHIPATG